eukprot:scaffold7759_cov471-Prasinococcus_capsulatus_cf.AAC.3
MAHVEENMPQLVPIFTACRSVTWAALVLVVTHLGVGQALTLSGGGWAWWDRQVSCSALLHTFKAIAWSKRCQ